MALADWHNSTRQAAIKKSPIDGSVYAVPSVTATVRQRGGANTHVAPTVQQQKYAIPQTQSSGKSLINWLKLGKRNQGFTAVNDDESTSTCSDIYRRLPSETRAHYLATVAKSVGRSTRLSSVSDINATNGQVCNYASVCEFAPVQAHHRYGTVSSRHGPHQPHSLAMGTVRHHHPSSRRPSVHTVFDTGHNRSSQNQIATPHPEQLMHTQWPAVYMAAPMMTPAAINNACSCKKSLMDTVRGRKKLCKVCSDGRLANQQKRTRSRPNLFLSDGGGSNDTKADGSPYAWLSVHRMASSETDLYGKLDEVDCVRLNPRADVQRYERRKHYSSTTGLFTGAALKNPNISSDYFHNEHIYQRSRTKSTNNHLVLTKNENIENSYRNLNDWRRSRALPVHVPCPVTPDVIPRPKLMTTFLPDPVKAASVSKQNMSTKGHRKRSGGNLENSLDVDGDRHSVPDDEWSDSPSTSKEHYSGSEFQSQLENSSLSTCVGVPGSRLAKLSLAGSSRQNKIDPIYDSGRKSNLSTNKSNHHRKNDAHIISNQLHEKPKSEKSFPEKNSVVFPPPPPPLPSKFSASCDNISSEYKSEYETPLKPPRKKKTSSESAPSKQADSKAESVGLPLISVNDILNVKSILKKTSTSCVGPEPIAEQNSDQAAQGRFSRLKKVHFRSSDSLKEDFELNSIIPSIVTDHSDIIAAINDVYDRVTKRSGADGTSNDEDHHQDTSSSAGNTDSGYPSSSTNSSPVAPASDCSESSESIDQNTCFSEHDQKITNETASKPETTFKSEHITKSFNKCNKEEENTSPEKLSLCSTDKDSVNIVNQKKSNEVAVSGHTVAIEIGEDGAWRNHNVNITTSSEDDSCRPASSLAKISSRNDLFNDTMRIHMTAQRTSVQNLFPASPTKPAASRVTKANSFRSQAVRPSEPPPPPPVNSTSTSSSSPSKTSTTAPMSSHPYPSTQQGLRNALEKNSVLQRESRSKPLIKSVASNATVSVITSEANQSGMSPIKDGDSSNESHRNVPNISPVKGSSFRTQLENKLEQRLSLTTFNSNTYVACKNTDTKSSRNVSSVTRQRSNFVRPVDAPQIPECRLTESRVPPLHPDTPDVTSRASHSISISELQSDVPRVPPLPPNPPPSRSFSEDWSSMITPFSCTDKSIILQNSHDSYDNPTSSSGDSPPPLPTSSPPPLTSSDSSTPENSEAGNSNPLREAPEVRLQRVIDSINAEQNRSSTKRRGERNSLAALGDLLDSPDSVSPNPIPSWPMLHTSRQDACNNSSSNIGVYPGANSVDHIYEEIPDQLARARLQTLLLASPAQPQSMFDGASRSQILSYLQGARERAFGAAAEQQELGEVSGIRPTPHRSNSSDISDDSLQFLPNKLFRGSGCDVERTDSGVGSESSCGSSSGRSDRQLASCSCHDCPDCDQLVEAQLSDSGELMATPSCERCSKKRQERREIITELTETEVKYSRDLRVVLEEFQRPMMVAGLLSQEHLSQIFLNVEELLDISQQLTSRLRDVLERALLIGDEDLTTVSVGYVFLENLDAMLRAFEIYCTKQSSASLLLTSLEKDRELLRVFLKVSQMENTLLRRMNLHSFLMVPIQRVTKYPLLFSRLRNVTPPSHETYPALVNCQEKIELHLEHMNAYATRDSASSRLWRRISSIGNNLPSPSSTPIKRSASELDITTLRLRKFGIESLGWSSDESNIVMEGRLLLMSPGENHWTRRGRNSTRMTSSHALLITQTRIGAEASQSLSASRNQSVCGAAFSQAALVLIKDKATSNRFTCVREPFMLSSCILCTDPDVEDCFEVHDAITKDSMLIKAEEAARTQLWKECLQSHMSQLGGWRKRRNALANIMIDIAE